MKYLKLFEDYSINEDRKIDEYIETLPVWKGYIHKFEKMRDDIRRKANPELYSEDDSVAEAITNAQTIR
jgi:hypothetical protein